MGHDLNPISPLTRFLAIDVKDLSLQSVLAVTGSIFVLTLAVLVVQIATSRFSTPARNDRAPSAIYSSEAKME